MAVFYNGGTRRFIKCHSKMSADCKMPLSPLDFNAVAHYLTEISAEKVNDFAMGNKLE